MRPKRKSYTTTGAKEWIPVNHYAAQYNVAAALKSGTATYGVEYTKADILGGVTPTAGEIFEETGQAAGQTASTELVYQGPVTAFRLNIAAISGELELQILTYSEPSGAAH